MSNVVLIADDDENDVLAISQTLSNAGVKNPLITVSDGMEVVMYFTGKGRYADREKFPLPGILLLDLKMRRIGGFAVMQWLNYEYESIRNKLLIVVLTGHGELDNVRLAYALGARSFLTKPCTVADVKNLVRGYSTYWEAEAPEVSVAAIAGVAANGGPIANAYT